MNRTTKATKGARDEAPAHPAPHSVMLHETDAELLVRQERGKLIDDMIAEEDGMRSKDPSAGEKEQERLIDQYREQFVISTDQSGRKSVQLRLLVTPVGEGDQRTQLERLVGERMLPDASLVEEVASFGIPDSIREAWSNPAPHPADIRMINQAFPGAIYYLPGCLAQIQKWTRQLVYAKGERQAAQARSALEQACLPRDSRTTRPSLQSVPFVYFDQVYAEVLLITKIQNQPRQHSTAGLASEAKMTKYIRNFTLMPQMLRSELLSCATNKAGGSRQSPLDIALTFYSSALSTKKSYGVRAMRARLCKAFCDWTKGRSEAINAAMRQLVDALEGLQ